MTIQRYTDTKRTTNKQVWKFIVVSMMNVMECCQSLKKNATSKSAKFIIILTVCYCCYCEYMYVVYDFIIFHYVYKYKNMIHHYYTMYSINSIYIYIVLILDVERCRLIAQYIHKLNNNNKISNILLMI